MSCLPVCQCAVGESQTVTKDSSTVHLQYMSFPSSWYPEVLFNLTTCWHGEHSRKGISEGHWAGINLIPDEIAPHPHPRLTCERTPDTDARHGCPTLSVNLVTSHSHTLGFSQPATLGRLGVLILITIAALPFPSLPFLSLPLLSPPYPDTYFLGLDGLNCSQSFTLSQWLFLD